MFRPFRLLIFTKVTGKSLASPVAVARVGNGGECGDGFVLGGVFEEL